MQPNNVTDLADFMYKSYCEYDDWIDKSTGKDCVFFGSLNEKEAERWRRMARKLLEHNGVAGHAAREAV